MKYTADIPWRNKISIMVVPLIVPMVCQAEVAMTCVEWVCCKQQHQQYLGDHKDDKAAAMGVLNVDIALFAFFFLMSSQPHPAQDSMSPAPGTPSSGTSIWLLLLAVRLGSLGAHLPFRGFQIQNILLYATSLLSEQIAGPPYPRHSVPPF